jgi:hypothetical protein
VTLSIEDENDYFLNLWEEEDEADENNQYVDDNDWY